MKKNILFLTLVTTVVFNSVQVYAQTPDVDPLPVIHGQCSAIIVTAPTATGLSAQTITGTTTQPLTYTQQGVYVVTWTYDDGAGNISTQTQSVMVDDTIAPIPDVANLPAVTGNCSVTVSTYPTATDACAGTLTGYTFNPLTYTSQGAYTVTWYFNDGNGNITTQNQSVIVDDVTAPVPDMATLPDITASCSTTVSVMPTATDNCAGSVTATTTNALTYTTQGTFVITWSYHDGNGNIATQTQQVIIDDVIPPVPDEPELEDIIAECSVNIPVEHTATDNCAGLVSATTTDPYSYNTPGTYVVTWTYNDGNGNTTTQTQNVIVTDNTAPDPYLPNLPNIVENCALTVFDVPVAVDNCAGIVFGTTSDPLSYNLPGTYVITWTFDDGYGNSVTQNQTVIVNGCTGVENESSLSLGIFPNPTTGPLTVSMENPSLQVMEYSLTNLLGQVITTGLLTGENTALNLDDLQNGTYYLHVVSAGMHTVKPVIIRK